MSVDAGDGGSGHTPATLRVRGPRAYLEPLDVELRKIVTGGRLKIRVEDGKRQSVIEARRARQLELVDVIIEFTMGLGISMTYDIAKSAVLGACKKLGFRKESEPNEEKKRTKKKGQRKKSKQAKSKR